MTFRFTIWSAIVLAAIVYLGVRLAGNVPFVSTDLFALLPEDARDPMVAEATTQSRDAFFRETLFLVAAPDRQALDAWSRNLHERLDAIDWIEVQDTGVASPELLELFLENRFRLLTTADRVELAATPEAHFRNGVLARLAMPGVASVFPLSQDPAGLLGQFVMSLPTAYPAMQPDALGYRRSISSRHYRLIVGSLVEPVFDPAQQQQLQDLTDEMNRMMRPACVSCELRWTGAVRFSAAARDSAEADIRLISGISMALIIVLFLLVFRRLSILLQAILPLVIAVFAGLAAGLAVFGQLNVLALVFGTTLLGLTIDYVFHFLVHRDGHRDAQQALRQVLPGLSLGLMTSLTAFAFLLFSGFPAITQLAVFSMAGLTAAWLTVIAVLPRFKAGTAEHASRIERLARANANLMTSRRVLFVLISVGLIVAVLGVKRLDISDDVQDLQAAPQALLENDRALRELGGRIPTSGFLLVEGETLNQRLSVEEETFDRAGGNAYGISRFLPSAQRRATNHAAYAPLFANSDDEPPAVRVLDNAGYRKDRVNDYIAAWRDISPVNVERWLEQLQHASPVQLPIIEAGDRVAHIVRLDDVTTEDQRRIAEDIDGLRFIEPLRRLESLFAEIRSRAVAAIALAYALVLILLVFRYGFVAALRTLLPSVIGGVFAIGTLGLFGLSLTVFSLMACILVLGIGADYSLFLRESGDESRESGLAITLAAITTLSSFGLLAASAVPALAGFGVAVAAGILGAYLAAPLCNDLNVGAATR